MSGTVTCSFKFLSLSLSERACRSLHTKKNLVGTTGNLQDEELQKMEWTLRAERVNKKIWSDGENFDRFLWFATFAEY